MADISAEEVESGPVENMPPFLQKFYDSLVRKRCVPANVSTVAISLCSRSFFFLILHSHFEPVFFPICFTSLKTLLVIISRSKIKPKKIQRIQTW